MKNNFLRIFVAAFIITIAASCNKDLNRTPTNALTSATALSNAAGYKQALAKVYGSFALTGSSGPGSTDLGGIDPGLSDFIRMYWNLQELASDEAVCAWI